jgi:anti-sigma B factor antagonist
MWQGITPGCGYAGPFARDGRCGDARMAAGGLVDLKLGHYSKDGIEVVNVEGEIDIYTAPRLRELLVDLVGKNNYQLIVNLEKAGFLDSTGLGVLVGGLKRVRPHDGWLDLVCTQERILKIFRITG